MTMHVPVDRFSAIVPASTNNMKGKLFKKGTRMLSMRVGTPVPAGKTSNSVVLHKKEVDTAVVLRQNILIGALVFCVALAGLAAHNGHDFTSLSGRGGMYRSVEGPVDPQTFQKGVLWWMIR